MEGNGVHGGITDEVIMIIITIKAVIIEEREEDQ